MKGSKYSYLIRPLFLLVDIFIIGIILYSVSDSNFKNPLFITSLIVSWTVISIFTKYYNIQRTTHILKLFTLYLKQITIFFLTYFAYFGLLKEGVVVNNQKLVFILIAIGSFIFRFVFFYALKVYRIQGKNYRNVIILGIDDTSNRLAYFFNSEKKYGYRFYGFFSNKKNELTSKKIGVLNEYKDYVLKNNIHEIYCSISSLSKKSIKTIVSFAKKNNVKVRLIPETTNIYSKNNLLEFYGTIPVLKPEKLPFERQEIHILKRGLDLFLSFFTIVFIMSWLVPIMAIIIKLDSKGPVFFKQTRAGINGNSFSCYKFRSMKLNSQSDYQSATKNDDRITKVGAFIRRTSLDEFPQFYNVFLGDMSIVGPRPHMNSQNVRFEKEINNYIKRYQVKPGITGLAQVSGYRGEIKTSFDIQNRVRLDLFYIENWSFFLDIKIIIRTILNSFKNEEKAY